MIYTISTDNTVPLTVCTDNKNYAVLESIAFLLTTKKGTVPGNREFGLPMEYIGKPMNVAETLIAQEVAEALEQNSITAKLKTVDISASTENFGNYKITVEVEI